MSSTVVPSGHQLLDRRPHLDPALGVEPRRRLVQEQDTRPCDEGRRDVEPPAHPTRVRLRRPVGRGHEVEPLEQLVACAR